MFVGSIVGLGLSPHMITALGWPSVFYIFGSMGIAWFFIWQSRAASTPAGACRAGQPQPELARRAACRLPPGSQSR
jgi:hypothetical protein